MKLKKILIVAIIMILCSVSIVGCSSTSKSLDENKPIKQTQAEINSGDRMLELIEQYPAIYDKSPSDMTSEELKAREEVVDILMENPDYMQYLYYMGWYI